MKSMLSGFAAALLIAAGAYVVLDALDYTEAARGSSHEAVRLGDAGPEDSDLIEFDRD